MAPKDVWTSGSCKLNVPFKVNTFQLCIGAGADCYHTNHVGQDGAGWAGGGFTKACRFTITMSQNGQSITKTVSSPAQSPTTVRVNQNVVVGGVTHTIGVEGSWHGVSMSPPVGFCDAYVDNRLTF